MTAGQETQVTITNAQAAATIKVCKYSSSPALQGAQYSFTVGTTTVTANAGLEQGDRRLLDRGDDAAGCAAEDRGGRSGQRGGREHHGRWQRDDRARHDLRRHGQGHGRRRARTSCTTTTSPSGRRRPATSRSARTPATSSSRRRRRSTSRSPTVPGSPTPSTSSPGQCSGPIKVAAGNVNVAEAPERLDLRERHLDDPGERARAEQPDQRHRHGRRAGRSDTLG